MEENEEHPLCERLLCPDLLVFDDSECLQYFSKDTISRHYLGCSNTEQLHSLSQIPHLVKNPEALLFMMSVCEEELAKDCWNYWQCKKKFTISVSHVIMIFLNWGATPKSLGIQDEPQLYSSFKITACPTSLADFPTSYHVKAVLGSISECLSNDSDENDEIQRHYLLRILAIASLDKRLSQYGLEFQQTICEVLKAYPVWTLEKVAELVAQLQQVLQQNAAKFFCNLFVTSPRIRDLKVIAVRTLLQSKFNFPPPQEPLQSLLQNLPLQEQITERFELLEIYLLIKLLNTLLITCNLLPNTCDSFVMDQPSEAFTIGLMKWTDAVYAKLMAPPLLFDIEASIIREKCVRLRADCKELVKNHDKGIFNCMYED
ncbi:uncharacterized protein LOC128986843 [Macrosteles quadrilineatus]|uniref:uncharacterized protein LOC128986843 n=1 Tax=Macrosteles quadrilineatus TaxID=74068 RepID=UPI0023E2C723|nr:uncharacterized protein LOC128986843 [Macrosteles quadrilineatus]